jgi:hypothetical protein
MAFLLFAYLIFTLFVNPPFFDTKKFKKSQAIISIIYYKLCCIIKFIRSTTLWKIPLH